MANCFRSHLFNETPSLDYYPGPCLGNLASSKPYRSSFKYDRTNCLSIEEVIAATNARGNTCS
jgi:hypothetical protein